MDLIAKPMAKIGKDKQHVKEIYMAAFEKADRMPFWLMQVMSRLWHTEFLAFYDGDILCGFVYIATLRKLTFIMFFAVDESLRSMGYGGRILDKVAQLHTNCKMIVSCEPCDEGANDIATRLRRKQFYLHNQYCESGYFLKLSGKEQEILIRNGEFKKSEFRLFFWLYSNFTMLPKVWKRDL